MQAEGKIFDYRPFAVHRYKYNVPEDLAQMQSQVDRFIDNFQGSRIGFIDSFSQYDRSVRGNTFIEINFTHCIAFSHKYQS